MTSLAHEVRVQAPRKQVFTALATTDGLAAWFTPHVEGQVATGQELVLRFPDRGETFRWRVTELTEDTSLRLECLDGPHAAPGTVVTYRLSDAPDGRTQVECDQEGWGDGEKTRNACNTRWGALMNRLQNYVEAGVSSPVLS